MDSHSHQYVSKEFCMSAVVDGRYQLQVNGIVVADDEIDPINNFSISHSCGTTSIYVNGKLVVKFGPAMKYC